MASTFPRTTAPTPAAPAFASTVRVAAAALSVLVAACAPLPPASSGAGEVLAPNAALHTEGIPPVPRTLVDAVARYTEFRGHVPVDWHPTKPELLIAFRPDGGTTAQLHRLAGPMATPEPITAVAEPVVDGQYEPDDRGGAGAIVYERASGGDEAAQLFRMDLATRATTVFSEPGFRHALGPWLHAGNRLVYTSVPLDRTAQGGTRAQITTRVTLIEPARPETRRLLAELPGGGWFPGGVSWDDRWLSVTRYVSAAESEVWIVDLASGERRRLLPAAGDATLRGVHIANGWRRDDRALLVLTDRGSDFNRLALADVADGSLAVLSGHIAADVDIQSVATDGRVAAATVNVDGRRELRLFDLASGRERAAPVVGGGSVREIRLHPTLPLLAVATTGSDAPRRIAVVPLDGAPPVAWTRPLHAPGVDPTGFREQRVVRWPSFDGRSISGLLSLPPARFTGPRPVVVDIHGGPEGQAEIGFLGRFNHVVEELGIAVIRPNVRGSSGFGRAFLALDNGLQREDSVRDIGALLDWIATQPGLDPKRVVVHGGSYGGYMVLAVATTYPERIAGAIDIVGISDFTTFLQNTESYRRDLRRVEYGDERDPAMRAFFDRISPLRNAGRIRAPLFVVHGKNDPRVPVGEAEQIVAGARAAGARVWYLRAENEGHGFARKENADFLFYATVLFLRETVLR